MALLRSARIFIWLQVIFFSVAFLWTQDGRAQKPYRPQFLFLGPLNEAIELRGDYRFAFESFLKNPNDPEAFDQLELAVRYLFRLARLAKEIEPPNFRPMVAKTLEDLLETNSQVYHWLEHFAEKKEKRAYRLLGAFVDSGIPARKSNGEPIQPADAEKWYVAAAEAEDLKALEILIDRTKDDRAQIQLLRKYFSALLKPENADDRLFQWPFWHASKPPQDPDILKEHLSLTHDVAAYRMSNVYIESRPLVMCAQETFTPKMKKFCQVLKDLSAANQNRFRAGFRFGKGLNNNERRQILEDLDFLAKIGPLKNAKEIARLMGVESHLNRDGTLDSMHIVSWIVNSITLLEKAPASGTFRQCVLYPFFSKYLLMLSDCSTTKWDKKEVIAWAEPYRDHHFQILDGEIAYNHDIGQGLVVLNAFPVINDQTSDNRQLIQKIFRLAVLIHEVAHLRIPMSGHYYMPTSFHKGQHDAADFISNGPYAIEAEFVRLMRINCRICSHRDLAKLMSIEANGLSYNRLIIEKPVYIGDILPEAKPTLTQFLPTLEWVKTMADHARFESQYCVGRKCSREFLQRTRSKEVFWRRAEQRLATLLKDVQPPLRFPVIGDLTFPEEYEVFGFARNADVRKWLDAALASPHLNYNVPLQRWYPCKEFKKQFRLDASAERDLQCE